ncbi:MAG: glycerate kinase [Deltaproteobacteria bacterium]|nr:glycerate kinase [Deltaproteobacteria bacterium]
MRVLIAPDKFKGSLSAVDVAAALAAGLRQGAPTLELRSIPLADGGEGTAAILREAVGGSFVDVDAHDAIGRPIRARYVIAQRDKQRTAYIDMSEASGLWRIDVDDRDPLRASTFGTGELLRHAIVESGADVVVMGLGGSATSDGGLGVARALGYAFVDVDGAAIDVPAQLRSLDHIEPPAAPWWREGVRVVVASDVRNPLLGPRGATEIYGPQKGLTQASDRAALEAALERFADVVAAFCGIDHRETPGAGAAGGLGFGLLSFVGAELRSGFHVVAAAVQLEAAVAWADVVVTGEGHLDAQTLEGKTAFGVATLARKLGRKTVAFAGGVDVDVLPDLLRVFDAVIELEGDHAQRMAGARDLLTTSAERFARTL